MKTKASLLLLLFGGFVCTLSAQKQGQQRIDSLVERSTHIPDDTNKVKLLSEASSLCWSINPGAGVKYGKQALELAEKLNWEPGIAAACGRIGVDYAYLFDHPKALEYDFRALKLNEKLGNKKAIAGNLNNIGNVYLKQVEYPTALDYYKRALKINEETGNKNWAARNLGNIGNIYWNQKKFDAALDMYFQAVKMLKETGGTSFVGLNYGNIGNVYNDEGNYPEALNYYFKSLAIHRTEGDKPLMANVYSNIAGTYLSVAVDTIKTHLTQGFKESKKELLLIGKAYIDSALAIEKENGNVNALSEEYGRKSDVYALLGDYKEALLNFKKSSQMKDSSFNLEKAKKITETSMRFEFEKKEDQAKAEQEQKDITQRNIRYTTFGGLAITLIFTLVLYKQRNRVKSEKKEVERQKLLVDEKNKDILESISYAKRIQYTMLAQHTLLEQILKDHFVYFQPKDIVSGDFYWATQKDDLFYLAVCDSTGHGVPGAFMSLLNISFLNEALNEKFITAPNEIFNYVRQRLIANISQDGGQDGMDAILLCIDTKSGKITYAAANNAPIVVRNNVPETLPADKMPVGKAPVENPFTLYELNCNKGDLIYLFTDGYADQFGGEKGKKFRSKNLNELLIRCAQLPFAQQKELLSQTFQNWKGALDQVDDVCVVGITV